MDTTAVLLHAIRSAISPTARSVSDKRETILRTSVSDNLLPCRAIRFPPGKRVPLFCNQKSSVAAYNGKRYVHDTTANIKVASVLVQLTSAVEECQAALWISGSWLARVMRMCAANLDDRATRLNAVIWVDQGLSLRSSAALRPRASCPRASRTPPVDLIREVRAQTLRLVLAVRVRHAHQSHV